MLIALGTKSAPKVAALELALDSLDWSAGVEAVSVPSGVSDMPMTSDELLLGAVGRARAALAAVSGADYGVGIEGGVAELCGRHYLTGVTVACDASGTWHAGWSPWIELPTEVVAIMAREPGRELGDIMDELAGTEGSKHKNGSWGLLTDDRLTRAESFRVALVAAFAPHISPLYRGR